MVAPLAVLYGASLAANAGIGLYTAYRNIKYQKAYMTENQRYWNDYHKRTGLRPKYPYRTGYHYNTASLYNSYASAVRSWTPLVGYGTSFQNTGYRSNYNYTHWMYA